MAEVPDRGLMIRSCQGEGGVRGEGPQILISVYLKTVNLNIFRNYGGIKTWRKSPDQSKESWKYLSLSLIVIIKRLQKSFHVQFSSSPWPWHIIWKFNSKSSFSGGIRYPTSFLDSQWPLIECRWNEVMNIGLVRLSPWEWTKAGQQSTSSSKNKYRVGFEKQSAHYASGVENLIQTSIPTICL